MNKFYFPAILLFLVALISPVKGTAQIQGRNLNSNTFFDIPKADKVITLSETALYNLKIEDSIDTHHGLPPRFGRDIEVDINIVLSGKSKTVNGKTVLTYSIKCPKALSINLIFNKLNLSESSELNLYSKDKKFRYGPITKSNTRNSDEFWTDIIPGDQIIVELITREDISLNEINISKVIYGYKKSYQTNLFGDSANCNIDINCPEGQGWDFESTSVSMILLANGTRLCSSALINNSSRDYKGFILSAFHCIDLNNNQIIDSDEKAAVNNWLFRFNYESPTCNGPEDNDFITFNGANYRAGYDPTDFLLVELFNPPTSVNCIAFAGWSRSASPPSSATGIHHPVGDVKKISLDHDALITNSNSINWAGGSISPSSSHWVVNFDQGTAQGGSSGSPIFDNNHRVVGQLHGGDNNCAPVTKYYGRFDKSWSGGGTPETRLKD